MAGKPKFTAEQVVEALDLSRGLVFLAAQALGCHPQTVRNYARRYARVREALEENRGRLVDLAEQKLAEAVEAGKHWAVVLTLKTLGKDRGYVERVETRDVSDEQLNAAIDAELARLAGRGEAGAAGPAAGEGVLRNGSC